MWRVDLARTRTGQLGARLEVETGGKISTETNGIPSAQVSARRKQLDRIPREWLEPWRNSLVFQHRYGEGDAWTPIMAGPIIHYPSMTRDSVALSAGGIDEVFRRRILEHEWSTVRDKDGLDANSIWRADGPYWEGSLGQIMWNVVQMAQAKPGGGLPIVHGTPDEYITDSTRVGRGWKNWDIDSNNVGEDILPGLSKEANGPDYRFTPQAIDSRRIRWAFEHGTHRAPHIAHPYTIRLDSTAARSPVSDIDITASGVAGAHRVYASGAGEGPGTLVRVSERLDLLGDETPLLEATISDTSIGDWRQVVSLAQGRARAEALGQWQIACTVATSPGLPLWQLRPGAPVQIRVAGCAPFPETWQRGRILKAAYTIGSDAVAIEIEQE